MKFSIRDLFLVTVIVALDVGLNRLTVHRMME
jgi:hypothetical protein